MPNRSANPSPATPMNVKIAAPSTTTIEASSIAAATAIGLGAAGAPLAVARRIRGLFCAGLGLAIYPRGAGSG